MNSKQADSAHSTSRKSRRFFLAAAFIAASILIVSAFKAPNQPVSFGLAALSLPGPAEGEIRADEALSGGSPELVLLGREALRPSFPPGTVTPQVLGAIIGQIETGVQPEIMEYAVEEGDTISSVAQKFGISENTILWANELPQGSLLKLGQELIILPVSGAMHLVRPSDTLSEIASWYKADAENIVEYNGLASSSEIFTGDLLIIPGGIMPRTLPQGRLTPVPNSYFIYPIPAPHRITQGLHSFNATDFSNGVCGESVYAAAGGTVQQTGYTSLGGNYVRILHPNGVVTYYGHLSSILALKGARVYQGQTVGYTGYTGYTIPRGPGGCHVHFEVRGAANPFAK